MSQAGTVKERGFWWLLFNSKSQVEEENIIETAQESEELKKSEARLKKMIDKYNIENFESFEVAKKTPKMKKAQVKGTIAQKQPLENQLEQEELER